MTEHHSDKRPAELEPTEARGGKPNHLRYILGASLVAIAIVMIIVVVTQAA